MYRVRIDVLFCYFFVNLLQTLIVLYYKRARLKTLFLNTKSLFKNGYIEHRDTEAQR